MGQTISSASGSAAKHASIEKASSNLGTLEVGGEKTVEGEVPKVKAMTFFELMYVLRPFFWPSEGSDGVLVNRIRAVSTWIAVALSKAASLYSPFFLSRATNDLVESNYSGAVRNIIAFCVLRFLSSSLKEMQSVLYIKVKQQASIELQTMTFTHLHNLSLSWHLNKKTGVVMKSMDRGVAASNELITYLFLYLIPALGECLAVAILFFAQFNQWSLGVVRRMHVL
jgi:ATP-binding cassette, subfamily B, heavy metal transporter